MKTTLCCLLFLFCLPAMAQYPFEKHPAIKAKVYPTGYSIENLGNEDTYNNKIAHHITIPKFLSGKHSLKLTINAPDTSGIATIEIYKGLKKKKLLAVYGYGTFSSIESFFVADYNHDHLPDIKFIIPHFGSGGYNYYCDVVYFLQRTDGSLHKVSFSDLLCYDYQNRPERDLDGDGIYEIVVCSFQHYKKHNYFSYDLYHLEGNKLVNVNRRFNYPIMIQLLYGDNYRITKHLTRKQMRQFENRLPSEYAEGKL